MDEGRFLLSGGTVIHQSDAGPIQSDMDVLVEDGRISQLRRRDDRGYAGKLDDGGRTSVIDVSGRIVMPGLIDTHRHTWQTPMRAIAADLTAPQYRSCLRNRFARHVQPDDVHIATLAGCLEALDAGVTTILDWAHIMNTPEHADASIDALQRTGMRAVFGHGTPNDAESAAWYAHSERFHPADVRRVRSERLAGDSELVTMALAVRSPHLVSDEVLVHDWTLARELDLRITVDGGLGGGTWSGTTWGPGGHEPIKRLERFGLLADDTTFVHCNNLPDDELALIAEYGAAISTSPSSEMHVGHCRPVTRRALERGVDLALSTDIVVQVSGDMFAAMRALLESLRGDIGSAMYADGRGPDAWEVTTPDVLGFATINGAASLGKADAIGSIEVGKEADLVVLEGSALNLRPVNDAVGLVVLQAHAGNVSDVFVRGRRLKADGVLDIEIEPVLQRLDECRDRLFRQAGMEVGRRPEVEDPGDEWRW